MDGLNTTCAQSNRCGSGGFFPFGAEGLIRGTAKCFYAYIGELRRYLIPKIIFILDV